MLKNGYEGNNKSKSWVDRLLYEQRKDELLKYIHASRDVEEHRVGEIVDSANFFQSFEPDNNDPMAGSMIAFGDHSGIEFSNCYFMYPDGTTVNFNPTPRQQRLRLLPVVNSGVRYDPPKKHFDMDIISTDPQHVAHIVAKYFEDVLTVADYLRDISAPSP